MPLAPAERKDEINAGRPWAKSGGQGRLLFDGGVKFRHELASLLMLDGPLNGLLGRAPDRDLARYLVLAHHGKLRVQVRDPGDLAVLEPGEAAGPKILGLEHGAHATSRRARPAATELTVDLDQFRLGGERSWTRNVLALRDRYGPFVLAYLETSCASRTGAPAPEREASGDPRSPAACPGIRPEPLASYLAGLGLIRVHRRAGRPGGDRRLAAGRAGHHHHRGGHRRLAGRAVRAHPGAEPVEQRQRLRRQGQGTAARAGGDPGAPVPQVGAAAGRDPAGPRSRRKGTRRRVDHRGASETRPAWSWSSATAARTNCCRGSTHRSCSPARTRCSRRCWAPAGTTAGWTSPPTSTSGCWR